MKGEMVFAKFDQLADAPDAVAKMRELVLQLAVTGKLVGQDEHDEPASSLLRLTQIERAKLVAAKAIKSRPIAPVEQDGHPFDLPSSWAWARLSDVGYELGQKVPNKRFTYIDVGGIDSDKGRISDRVEKLEPGDAPSRARKLVKRGTVIYSTVRPYLLNIAIVDKEIDPEPIASTAFGILHPFEGISNRYLFYWLRSAPFTAYVQAGMKGMAYPAINDEKFYSGYIALPPAAEQKRIVAKVDEFMALCDRLEAQQQERETRHAALARASLARFADAPTPPNLEFLFHKSYTISPADLRKSILTLAVQGKLVPQDQREQRAPTVSDTETEVGFEVPENWVWTRLAELQPEFQNGASSRGDKDGTPVIVIRLADIRNRRVSLHEPRAISISRDQIAKYQLRWGDTLITRVNGSADIVGTFIPIQETLDAIYCDHFIRMRFDSELLFPAYIALVGATPLVREQIKSRFITTAGQKTVNQEHIRSLRIPLPPLAEQRRIVAKVEQLMALVDEMETQLVTSRATAASLLDAVVSELTLTA